MPADSIEQVDARSDEMVAAIAWFVEAGRTDEALRLANALYRLWIVKRRFEEGDRVFTQVLESGAGDPRLRARAFLHAGFMPFWMGDDAGPDRSSASRSSSRGAWSTLR